MNMKFKKRHLLWIIVGCIGLVLPLFLNSYICYLIDLTLIYAILAIGLNVLSGNTGQLSIGHSGFFAIGAYAGAILLNAGIPLLLSLILSGVITCLTGILLGLPALRLKGLYLAIATLAFGVVVPQLINEFKTLTGGMDGISVNPPNVFGITLTNDLHKYYFILGIFLLTVYCTHNFLKFKVRRAFIALRDDELAAGTMGINITIYKLIAFGYSAFLAGISGTLYVVLITYINPQEFGVIRSINFFAMIVIGGLSSISGSILGAGFVTLLPEILRPLKDIQGLVFGILMILVMVFFSKGINGFIKYFDQFLKKKVRGKKHDNMPGN